MQSWPQIIIKFNYQSIESSPELILNRSFKYVRASLIAIYAPMIYTALCIMLLMRAASITRTSGRGVGSWKSRADRRVKYGSEKGRDFLGPPPPTCPSYGFARIKRITYRALSIRGPKVVFCTRVSENKTKPHSRYGGWVGGWVGG